MTAAAWVGVVIAALVTANLLLLAALWVKSSRELDEIERRQLFVDAMERDS
jgi:hypothetical protein